MSRHLGFIPDAEDFMEMGMEEEFQAEQKGPGEGIELSTEQAQQAESEINELSGEFFMNVDGVLSGTHEESVI